MNDSDRVLLAPEETDKGQNSGTWAGAKGRLADLVAAHFYSPSDPVGRPEN